MKLSFVLFTAARLAIQAVGASEDLHTFKKQDDSGPSLFTQLDHDQDQVPFDKYEDGDTKNIIICDEVKVVTGSSPKSDGNEHETWKRHVCVQQDGEFELVNLWPTFEEELNAAKKNQSTRLVIGALSSNLIFSHNNRIILPTDNETFLHFWTPLLFSPSSSKSNTARRLAKSSGQSTAVAILLRFTDLVPSINANQVGAALFGNGALTPQKQMAACSYNKFQLKLVGGKGAIDVNLGLSAAGWNRMSVVQKIIPLVGPMFNADQYDHVLWVLPQNLPSDISWIAFAQNGGLHSFYNDDAIMILENTMHELVHNMGFEHSSQQTDPLFPEYGDTTGYMGWDDTPTTENDSKCYNGAKSYQLGWYDDKVQSIDFQDDNELSHYFKGKLIGVVDYGKSTEEHTVVLKIDSTSPESLYLTYNRKKGINKDTGEAGDSVTVTESEGFGNFSCLIHIIERDNELEIENYHDGLSLLIKVGPDATDGMVDYVPLEVCLGFEGVCDPIYQSNGAAVLEGEAGGDPHFKTFGMQYFSYHGQCDLVLSRIKGFGIGLDLDVHIRTTRVDNPNMSYSYISGVAVGMSSTVINVSEDGSLFVDGHLAELRCDYDDTLVLPNFAEQTIRCSTSGAKKRILAYVIELNDNGERINIRVNKNTNMMYVDLSGAFADGEGLLGQGGKDGLLARDGLTDLSGEWNSFGEEWQVRDTDRKLFLEDRHPQYPASCMYDSSKTKSTSLRRRRLSDHLFVTPEVANEACAHLTNPKKREFCITDVMATGLLDIADDPFYA